MNYIMNFHWIWYGLGFLTCPRLTIMIILSIYAKNLNIPTFLMIIGWIFAILSLCSGASKGETKNG